MRKIWIAAMAALLVGVSWAWAQAPTTPRKHSRPPYSGPRKARTGHSKARPVARAGARFKPGVFHPAAPNSGHGMDH